MKPENIKELDMDILDIGTAKENAEITLYHPVTSEVLLNEDGSEMTITVAGPYSAKYKKLSHDQQNRRLQKAQRTGGRLNLTAQEIEASAFEIVVKCVEGWNITLGGEKPECTEAKVREVLTTYPWIKEAVDQGLSDNQSFLGD